MLAMLSQYWWTVALRGVAAILFGIATLVAPDVSLYVLVILFGSYSLVDGAIALVAGIRSSSPDGRPWGIILEGIAGITLGVLTFVWPGVTAIALLYLIAAWALITGVLEIVAAVRMRQVIDNEWLMGLAGVASILFGGSLIVFPGPGALAVVTVIGAYALIFGVLLIALGLRLRGLQPSHGGSSTRTGFAPGSLH